MDLLFQVFILYLFNQIAILDECGELGEILSNNIFVCGGLANTKNLFSKLKLNFYDYSHQNYIIKKISDFKNNTENDETVWKGGALLSELPCCRNNWITKSEYLENKNIVFQKNEFKISN